MKIIKATVLASRWSKTPIYKIVVSNLIGKKENPSFHYKVASALLLGSFLICRATRNIFRLLGLLILITLLIFNSLGVGLEFLARHYHQ
ncbi:hypothetical protein RIF29_22135 [Crotalaria pallida]|uniref:Uncharacterized protein n=1 Tax=Crotalaria pallida TaxID=3830 RepID=A0AAN9I946_CROPI